MTVIARINVESPTGRKILRELEKHRNVVEIDNPLPDVKTYSVNEAYERGLDQLTTHYDVDIRKLKSKL